METAYAVKHKETGLFFGGFDSNNDPLWVNVAQARRMDKSAATSQALLFARFHVPVQKKPFAL